MFFCYEKMSNTKMHNRLTEKDTNGSYKIYKEINFLLILSRDADKDSV